MPEGTSGSCATQEENRYYGWKVARPVVTLSVGFIVHRIIFLKLVAVKEKLFLVIVIAALPR